MKNQTLSNRTIVDQLKRKLGLAKNRDFARRMGWSDQQMSGWVNKPPSALTIANLLLRAEERAQAHAIEPIVEFHDIKAVGSRQGAYQEVFNTGTSASTYAKGLRERLKGAKGIYIFYDSRGRALYVGKTQRGRNNLWSEIKNAFNRDRGEVQEVWRVRHPKRNQRFDSDVPRKPKRVPVQLHELARYMSVYKVGQALIGPLEALLIRGFANDLLNARMEGFSK